MLSSEFQMLSPTGVLSSLGLLVSSIVIYAIGTCIYNLFFHPLKHIPGPFFARACGIPYSLHMRRGTIVNWLRIQHDVYGDAVRVTPSEVSFISGETAWPDIYGFRTGKYKNTGAYLKDHTWFPKPVNGVWSIIVSNEEDHTRLRRNLAHAFSDKALRSQETLLQDYTNQLVSKLGSRADEGKPLDIMTWYSRLTMLLLDFTTFDIIADLSFGESLNCLRNEEYHTWVDLIFASLTAIPILSIRKRFLLFRCYDRLKDLFSDNSAVMQGRKEFFMKARDLVTQRLDKKTDRPDFFSFILANQSNEAKALTRDEMDVNAVLLMIAGSETTATTLSGTTFLLLRNREAYAKLVHEVRSTFTSDAEITIERVNKLEYMIACLQEGLRYYPPVPTGLPRTVPAAGDTISGHYIPGGTSVYVSQHATNHSARNFSDADMYVPERWLGAEKYKDDKREVVNPFSFGPRNCLGKNLAYAEMRLILAKVLFEFDLELVEQSDSWMADQKVFGLWRKPPLMVKLRRVER